MAKRKKRRPSGDLFAGRKGTQITVTIDAELLKIIDAYRVDVEELTGVTLDRRAVLEGMLRKTWREKLLEASALAGGAHLSGGVK